MGLGAAPTATPEPTPPDRLGEPTIPLPNDPIEPYLLTKENGPFMVMAKSFRGPDAERFALALVLELRRDYGLPAYILRYKDFPQHSLVRNLPPTAPTVQNQAHVGLPEKYRTYDEAVVLVGNEKSVKGRDVLLHKVKKIRPQCLNGLPKLYPWREGLNKALGTTNPFVPAQDLYAAPRRDPMIVQMNEGPRSVMHCPGRYTLQIAEFSGRSTLVEGRGQGVVVDQQFVGNQNLRKSPLATAAQDAEGLAEALAKDPEVRQTGYFPYTYHDRTSSRVLIGSFNCARRPRRRQAPRPAPEDGRPPGQQEGHADDDRPGQRADRPGAYQDALTGALRSPGGRASRTLRQSGEGPRLAGTGTEQAAVGRGGQPRFLSEDDRQVRRVREARVVRQRRHRQVGAGQQARPIDVDPADLLGHAAVEDLAELPLQRAPGDRHLAEDVADPDRQVTPSADEPHGRRHVGVADRQDVRRLACDHPDRRELDRAVGGADPAMSRSSSAAASCPICSAGTATLDSDGRDSSHSRSSLPMPTIATSAGTRRPTSRQTSTSWRPHML